MLTLKGNRNRDSSKHCVAVYLFIYLLIYLFIYLSIYLFIYLFTYLFMLLFESDLGENHCLSMFLILINVFKVNFPVFNIFM